MQHNTINDNNNFSANNQVIQDAKYSKLLARIAIAFSIFAFLAVATVSTDNPLNPCGNIAEAQSTLCNVDDNHSFGSGVIVNDDGGATAVSDFRVEGGTQTNLIDTDAANNVIGFGQDATTNVSPIEFGLATTFNAAVAMATPLAVVDGGTGSSTFSGASYIGKQADEVITTDTTLSNDAELFFAVIANELYSVHGAILWTTPAAANFKFGWNIPAATTVDCAFGNFDSGNWAEWLDATTKSQNDTEATVNFSCIFNIDSTGGTVSFEWAQVTSDGGNTTVHEGSWIAVTQLN